MPISSSVKRCTRCILPESAPNIAFDDDGVCNYCRSHRTLEYQGESELLRILDSHRREDSIYDAIVNISGGRDSTYTLLKLARDYRMKVLAVNYENPFTDPQAAENIERATKALDVEIVRFKLKNKIHERTFRNNVVAWFRRPSPGLVPMICVGCKTIWWDILKIARKYDIHCIVSGGNRFEDVSFKKVLLGTSAGERPETTLIKDIRGIVKETSKNRSYYRPQFISTLVKGYLFGNPYTIGSRILGHRIARIDLFFFLKWDEQEVLSRIQSELDWEYPRRLRSTWRFDCRVGHLKDLMYKRTIGLTEKEGFYSIMIREGSMTREEALRRLDRENELHWGEIESLLRQVEIENIPVTRIIRNP